MNQDRLNWNFAKSFAACRPNEHTIMVFDVTAWWHPNKKYVITPIFSKSKISISKFLLECVYDKHKYRE